VRINEICPAGVGCVNLSRQGWLELEFLFHALWTTMEGTAEDFEQTPQPFCSALAPSCSHQALSVTPAAAPSFPKQVRKPPTPVSQALLALSLPLQLNVVSRAVTASIMESVYDLEIKDKSDPFYKIAEIAMASLSHAGIFGTFYVDFFPFLKYVPSWLPGAGFQQQAVEWGKYVRAMRDDGLKSLEARMVDLSHFRSQRKLLTQTRCSSF
jgi:hypothetical protein